MPDQVVGCAGTECNNHNQTVSNRQLLAKHIFFANSCQERRNKKAVNNISRTRGEKAKAQTEYTEANKQVKRSIRTDKRKYVEDLAMTVEKTAREENMRQLYDTTKKLAENYRKPE
ncbi:unnamed protein product [Schistosoma curassoni]|uniref:Uncharacterized protein n=1 Tax=Schistosoma curassoni TaxID=6186 RepID=A0A3P8CZH9_9TREM|nr:unnamed protein product [Schistosoma curassoni]